MSRLFGTDGVRGIANKELTPELAYNLGKAAAFLFTKDKKKARFFIGKDTRISGDILENAISAGLMSQGVNVISLGVVPTPAVAYLVRKHNADAGIVISASHNSYEYNGIKFFNKDGFKLSDSTEDEIQKIIEDNFVGIETNINEKIGIREENYNLLTEYINYVTSTTKLSLENFKIALDCANGASYAAAEKVFKGLGAEVITINNNPNYININENCGSTHPEMLQEIVTRFGCDMGFAFDGDADRCFAVDEKGNLINGDKILAMCGTYLKEEGKLKNNTVAATIMSNMGLDTALTKSNINLIRTNVGDRYVLENMISNGYSLGGEESGHIIFLEHNTTGDGLITAVQIASIVKHRNKKLSVLSSIMEKYPQVNLSVKVPKTMIKIHQSNPNVKEKLNKYNNELKGSGRIIIRASGTEPVIRIMVEGKEINKIESIADSLKETIIKSIKM